MSSVREWLEAYYASNDECNRILRQPLEFSTTFFWFERLWNEHFSRNPEPIKVADVGAGCGIYSEFWLKKGAQVVAIEPVEKLTQVLVTRLGHHSGLTLIQSTHVALTQFPHGYFDLVILAGPLYHLFHSEDRLELIRCAWQRLRPGGWLWAVHLSRGGFVRWVWRHYPDWIENQPSVIFDVVEKGYDSRIDDLPETPQPQFLGFFDSLDSLQQLYSQAGLSIKSLLAIDPLILGDEQFFLQLKDSTRKGWMEVLAWLSHWPELWGLSRTWAVLSQKNPIDPSAG